MKTDSRKTYFILAAVAVLLWTIDTIFDTLFAHQGTFSDFFAYNVPFTDVIFRLLFIGVVIVMILAYLRQDARREATRAELNRHLAAIETSMDGIALLDAGHAYLYVNDAYARITGFRSPRELAGKTFDTSYSEEQRAWMAQHVFPPMEATGNWHGELTARRKDGTLFDQEASMTRMADGGFVCVMRDITSRKQREEALQRSERFLSTIFDSIRDPFCIFDRDYRIVRANDTYAELKDRAVSDLLEETCFAVLAGRTDPCADCVIQKTVQTRNPCAKEKSVVLKDGETVWLELYTYPIFDESGAVTYVIEYTRNITDRKRADDERKRLIDRLEYLSNTDGLTGLLNRRALTEQLNYELDRIRRYGGDLSVILCDMDNLKEINDRHGHLAGDVAIQLVAGTLRNSLRAADIAGRYGGDEFLVIVPQTALSGARSIAEKIQSTTRGIEVSLEAGRKVAVSVSMGITALTPGDNMDTLISRVDQALYTAKQSGKDRIFTFE